MFYSKKTINFVMPEVKISVRGISVWAFHGLEKNEARLGSQFSIGFDAFYDEPSNPLKDTLKGRPDYARICNRIVELFKKQRYRLMEPLGAFIADTLLKEFPILTGVKIYIRKLKPALSLPVEYSEIEVTRIR
ncbi:TPA: hypothetical protein DEF17_09380 [bacterium]|nr:MAG: hypothetical protein AUJ18_04760 [Candidatus Hydrogenedentes bacterium CG1_02_42_14]PIU47436.1 MAG: hypothetical protein COS94_07460 [Candidatus Hydrogenedentes bacterium CG07_land_8_20_14_0_80_42_17]HBW48119.1 hypothetical protein [bacterium]